ncbi:MAG: NADP-dependent oxidoreductase [Deltaproteobacteria bacterium]|nr:NADP-dependent oxidoreductase [Deltaproteobacteria bacterium]
MKFGSTEHVEVKDVDRPVLRENHVLIEVRASSINPVDVAIRDGRMKDTYHLQPPLTLGFDVAGTIVEVGPEVRGFAVGNEVFGAASVTTGGSGAWAELAMASVATIARKPRSVGFVEAAAGALAGATAVQALHDVMKLHANERVLIHGGAGGVGSIAIQLAKQIGAHVTATATGPGIEFAKKLGADRVIDYKVEDFVRGGRQYHGVLDTVGGDTYRRSFEVLLHGGALVSLRQPVDLELMRLNNVKAYFQLTRVTHEHLAPLARLVDEQVMRIQVERTFPLEKIREALQIKEKDSVRGKLGIEVTRH